MSARLAGTLVERARTLIVPGERRLLGITGAPAAGKSTLAGSLVAALAPEAVLVPMDGFHLAAAQLRRLGRLDRKGAPDTFDAAGYLALLHRLRDRAEDVVYAPEFRREIEEPIAGAIAVPREVPLAITEGNYLLYWNDVRELLDEVWFVDLDEPTRLARLIERHMAYGRTRAEAEQRTYGSDQRNAEHIMATRMNADLIVGPR
ncbi:MAG TPA: nucleoside/nucleotide kinase family protein [Jatrophihabitantaceae bacterium]|jgi:pantothenate kinase|nr:nucleoside/nucleotide kinase family protein [Jatrophihabitantaceae bacterium]